MRIPAAIRTNTKSIEILCMIDSGAGGKFINDKFVAKHQLPRIPLSTPLPVFNADGTLNH